jgi:hypothetical protein
MAFAEAGRAVYCATVYPNCQAWNVLPVTEGDTDGMTWLLWKPSHSTR